MQIYLGKIKLFFIIKITTWQSQYICILVDFKKANIHTANEDQSKTEKIQFFHE